MLITTREAAIAKIVGASSYDLDTMTPDQARAPVEGRLGQNLGEVERHHALALAKAVGYLPLAMELAAAQAVDGISWTELREDLETEVVRLEALDLCEEPGIDEYARKRFSLLGSFYLSLRRLSEQKRRDFAWLGVLPEDVTLNSTMASTLWSTDERSARMTLRSFRDKALLLTGSLLADGTQTFRLHDLMHDLARRLLVAPLQPNCHLRPGLGLTLARAHADLISRYRALVAEGSWHTLPVDHYIHVRVPGILSRLA